VDTVFVPLTNYTSLLLLYCSEAALKLECHFSVVPAATLPIIQIQVSFFELLALCPYFERRSSQKDVFKKNNWRNSRLSWTQIQFHLLSQQSKNIHKKQIHAFVRRVSDNPYTVEKIRCHPFVITMPSNAQLQSYDLKANSSLV